MIIGVSRERDKGMESGCGNILKSRRGKIKVFFSKVGLRTIELQGI